MKIRWAALALAAGSVLSASPVLADLKVEMKVNDQATTLSTQEHKMRVENPEMVMIFRADKKVLWNIDPAGKTYSEMTEADAKAMGQQMDAAMAKLQEAMKDMPPEQRAAMEAMMKKHQPMATQPKKIVAPTGQTKTINGFPCREYTATYEDGKVADIWSAEPKDLKIERSDLGVFTEFGEFMKTMLPGMDQFSAFMKDWSKPAPEGEVPGVPILMVQKDASGKETMRAEIVTVNKAGVPDAAFDLPAGLAKQELGMKRSSQQGD